MADQDASADGMAGQARQDVVEDGKKTRTAERPARRPLQSINVPNATGPAQAPVANPVATSLPAAKSEISSTAKASSTRSASAQPPPSTKSTISTSHTLTSAASSSADASDFLARAKAMGLNLTMQDYERARAGVSAFLRAERVKAITDASTSTSSSSSSATMSAPASARSDAASLETKQAPSRRVGTLHSTHSAPQSSSSLGEASRRNAANQLSFFTAVVSTPSPEQDKKPSRPRLDDIGSLIERRMRREKRRRLRERAEREGSDADCESGMHRRNKPRTSSASTLVPLMQSSPSTSVDLANMSPSSLTESADRGGKSGSRRPRSSLALASTSTRPLRKISSEGDLDSAMELWRGDKVGNPQALQSPVRLSQGFKQDQSPSLTRLTRKAVIDESGHLILLETPRRGEASTQSEPESDTDNLVQVRVKMTAAELDDGSAVATEACSGGMDTDDSGVCITSDTIYRKNDKEQDCIGTPRWLHRRRVSSLDFSSHKHSSPDGMSFLDRVMAQKSSPLRLRREVKAREQQARLAAAQNDLVVMTAATTTTTTTATITTTAAVQDAESASMPPPAPVGKDRGHESHGASASSLANPTSDAKSVRWASEFGSPRQRMTTKEIYDLEFYGITPSVASGHHTPAHSFGSWEQAISEQQQSSVSKNRFTGYGSPVSSRNASSSVNNSPDVLLTGHDERGMANHSMRRGLLFGSTSGEGGMYSANSSLDGTFGDLVNVFSQGPTLASSPARKSLDAGETPPRLGLVRANTLATPVTLSSLHAARENSLTGSIGNFGSPERGTLMRSHSTGNYPRMHSRRSSLLAPSSQETDKENVPSTQSSTSTHATSLHSSGGSSRAPTGWAHRSPLGKAYPTISPAAVFGLHHQHHHHNHPQQYHGPARHDKDCQADGQPLASRHQTGPSGSFGTGQVGDVSTGQHANEASHTASDAEGHDERDGSPIHRFKGRSRDVSRQERQKSNGKLNDNGHARDSSQSGMSAFGDSPLILDLRNAQARVVPNPESSFSLAMATDMPRASQPSAEKDAPNGQKRKRKEQQAKAAPLHGDHMEQMPPNALMPPHLPFTGFPGMPDTQMEWAEPDGSRIVRLISEELEQALKSGTMTREPPPRFYRLPPGAGQSNAKPQSSSYAGMIGQAILSSSDGRLSLNEIYNWIATVYPFFERGDRGWQNSIRHNLSLNKSFMKVEREAHNPGKGGLWAIKPGHETCFRAGNYFAPGSAKGSMTTKEAYLSSLKTPKTPHHNALPISSSASSIPSSQPFVDQTGQMRRKRVNSERSATSEHASDSEGNSRKGMSRKANGNARRTKKGRKEHIASSRDGSPAQVLPLVHSQPAISRAGYVRFGPQSVAPQASMVSLYSPRDFNTITPSRPYNPRQMGTSSSDIGSGYASSAMASMPHLTDASSPPSSPQSIMPPPAGGIHGAASMQSAQKRRESGQSQGMLNGNVFYGSSFGAPLSGAHFGSGIPANMFAPQQSNVHSSPLAHMRAHGAHISNVLGMPLGANHRGMASAGVTSDTGGSPIRHSNASPSRLLMRSPPVSSIRGGEIKMNKRANKKPAAVMGKSPSKFLAHHSPVRGSPLRPGGPLNQSGQQLASPAGMSMQMALSGTPGGPAGTSSSSAYNGVSAFLNFEGEGNSGTTPLTQRFSYASPSPSRRLLDTSFSPAFSTPNMHAHGATGLDDPFGYSGHLQHELDFASMASDMHHMSSFGAEPSPMKGLYAQHHQYPGHYTQTSDSPSKAAGAARSTASEHTLSGAF